MSETHRVVSFLNEVGVDPYSPPPEDFDNLSTEDAVELIKAWFFINFEDPANYVSYNGREGGYQYIWGPYSTRDIIENVFADAPEEMIKAAIDELESEGDDWVPSQARIQPPDDEELPTRDEAAEVHAQMLERIAELEKALAEAALPPAIGHNKPPEPIDDLPLTNLEKTDLQTALLILKTQPVYPDDDGAIAREAAQKIETIGSKLRAWCATQADNFVTEAVKKAGAVAGAGLAAYLATKLLGLSAIVMEWISLIPGY